jgi:hypothetical protein
MTISDISSLASTLAVLGTLVFLVIQTRQTAQNQKSLLQQGRTARLVEIIAKAAEPNFGSFMSRAYSGDVSLKAAEVRSMNAYAGAFFWSYEDSFLQHKAGLLDAASWTSDLSSLRSALTQPVYRAGWHFARQLLSGEYRDFVDSLMRETKPEKPLNELTVWRDLMSQALAEAV